MSLETQKQNHTRKDKTLHRSEIHQHQPTQIKQKIGKRIVKNCHRNPRVINWNNQKQHCQGTSKTTC